MLRKIAIVGANGFVGRHLVELASEAGALVTGVVRSEAGASVVRDRGGTPIRIPDLQKTSTDTLVPSLAGCEGLVYTASVSSGPGSPDRTDPLGLVNVLNACAAARVPRVVFFSGLGVASYGTNLHCTNPYFLAKWAGEVALFRSGIPATVFRPSYIFGAGEEFLGPLISRIAVDSVVEIPGDGQYRLQPISVRDSARAALGALEETSRPSQVIDLVGPESITYRALVERVARIMGRSIKLRERPVSEALALSRKGGYFGLGVHDLACLLCDEVSDHATVEALIGQRLESVDAMLAAAAAMKPAGPVA